MCRGRWTRRPMARCAGPLRARSRRSRTRPCAAPGRRPPSRSRRPTSSATLKATVDGPGARRGKRLGWRPSLGQPARGGWGPTTVTVASTGCCPAGAIHGSRRLSGRGRRTYRSRRGPSRRVCGERLPATHNRRVRTLMRCLMANRGFDSPLSRQAATIAMRCSGGVCRPMAELQVEFRDRTGKERSQDVGRWTLTTRRT